MTNCKYITKNGRCGLKGSYAYRHGCFGEDMCRCREPMTNAQRIRAMSDEELAERFTDATYYKASAFSYAEWAGPNGVAYSSKESAKSAWLKWLQQPAEEDDHAEP